MKWTWPFGNTAREAKTAWPLAMLGEPRAVSLGARDAGALIRDVARERRFGRRRCDGGVR